MKYPTSIISGVVQLSQNKGYNTNPVHIEFSRRGGQLRHININTYVLNAYNLHIDYVALES